MLGTLILASALTFLPMAPAAPAADLGFHSPSATAGLFGSTPPWLGEQNLQSHCSNLYFLVLCVNYCSGSSGSTPTSECITECCTVEVPEDGMEWDLSTGQ